jgi:cytochrome c oxidase subunit 1
MYDERPARVACLMVFVGFLLTFVPQFIAGLQGMPRRYAQLPIEFALNNTVSSVGALILAGGMFLTLRYLIDSLRHGEPAPPNPWGGATLEWATHSPPVTHNFEQDLPPITGPYNYKVLQKISDDTGYVRNDGWNLR